VKKNLIGMILALAVVVTGLLACGGDKARSGATVGAPATALTGSITIKNLTGKNLNEMLISPASEENNWNKEDHFKGKVLKNGQSVEIKKSIFTKDENYDLTFTSVDGDDYYIWEVDVKHVNSIEVTKDDLDKDN
jgi:hypothetical protein